MIEFRHPRHNRGFDDEGDYYVLKSYTPAINLDLTSTEIINLIFFLLIFGDEL